MLVLTEEEMLDLIDSSRLVKDVNKQERYNGYTYDLSKFSVHPSENKDNIKEVIGFKAMSKTQVLAETEVVVVSFCARGAKDICFTTGTKVLMRNGEYKTVDDLKNTDLLMTSLPITELDHIAEVKNVYIAKAKDIPSHLESVTYVLNVEDLENFEYNGIFIKTR